MLLSDNTLSTQQLDSVVLSNRCTYNEEIHDTSLLGKSLLNIYYTQFTVNPHVQHWLYSENFIDKEAEEDPRKGG